ncbi:MAG: YlxR family protein [Lachnospiraceae bacterium]|nr:YlxR family protein [Lachnospiraceae bacterium]
MKAKKIPMRQCVGCGEMKAKKELARIIKTPEEDVIFDMTGRKNGRGAYICANMDCLKKARERKGLERSLKITIPTEVYSILEEEMSKVAK